MIIVNDMLFAMKFGQFLLQLKARLANSFDVKYFEEFKQFVRWEVHRDPRRIIVSKRKYFQKLVAEYEMRNWSGTLKPVATHADIFPL